jgi:sugar phosphate isomerase/epimerase
MRLGIVTYNIASDWDIPAILANCSEVGIYGVELRTTHAHGVEPSLSPQQRREVRDRFADSPVDIVGLGTTCEFHAIDQATVQENIETAKEFAQLAHDLNATGIKVRPNGLQEEAGVSREQTLAQIGTALSEVGEAAQDLGVQVWVEMHGPATAEPHNVREFMDNADHSNVSVCWNSNPQDVADGSIAASYALVGHLIRHVHINRLFSDYPYQELFKLLNDDGYSGWLCAEIPESADPLTLLQYYRTLFHSLGA